MKTLFPPLLVVLLCTGLTAWCCHLSGMPPHDLWIAGTVAFGASASAVSFAVVLAGAKSRRAADPK